MMMMNGNDEEEEEKNDDKTGGDDGMAYNDNEHWWWRLSCCLYNIACLNREITKAMLIKDEVRIMGNVSYVVTPCIERGSVTAEEGFRLNSFTYSTVPILMYTSATKIQERFLF